MELSLSRLFNLIRKDFILNKKVFIYFIFALFAICGIMMFLVGDEIHGGKVPPDAGEIVYGMMLVVCGALFSLSIFREYRSAGSRVQYLALPASHLEKFLAKWIYVYPLYFLICTVVFLLGYKMFGLLFENVFTVTFFKLEDLHFEIFKEIIKVFIGVQAVSLFFSSLFNKYPIPKSLAFGFVAWMASVFVVIMMLRIIFHEQFTGVFTKKRDVMNMRLNSDTMSFVEGLGEMNLAVPMISIALFFWVVTYFKVKEKEA